MKRPRLNSAWASAARRPRIHIRDDYTDGSQRWGGGRARRLLVHRSSRPRLHDTSSGSWSMTGLRPVRSCGTSWEGACWSASGVLVPEEPGMANCW